MKHILSRIFYWLGDAVSISAHYTGVGYDLYQRLMSISVNLDTDCRVWPLADPNFGKWKVPPYGKRLPRKNKRKTRR